MNYKAAIVSGFFDSVIINENYKHSYAHTDDNINSLHQCDIRIALFYTLYL